MKLTNISITPSSSLVLIKSFIDKQESTQLLEHYLTLPYHQDEYVIYGKTVKSPQLIHYMGEVDYKYSGAVHKACQFDQQTYSIISRLPHLYNSCLFNLYRDGDDSISMHTDNESCLDLTSPVISLSLGSSRTFIVKEIATSNKTKVLLESGDLAIMCGKFQQECLHGIEKERSKLTERISLTFRRIV